MIKGGNLENTVVFIDQEMDEREFDSLKAKFGLASDVVLARSGIVNDVKLRFPRHKVLDLIGDLALLGLPLQAHIVATRKPVTRQIFLL